MLEYAPQGLLGVLTPQGNTTVEPELAILAPPGLGVLNARMRSDAAQMHDRLLDYVAALPEHVAQFANAPLTALALATTGPSYLIGPEEESRTIASARARGWPPLVTAAVAVRRSLEVLHARRIALVSPYPELLTQASEGYWRACGLTVDSTLVVAGRDAFHPIYALDSNTLRGAVNEARRSAVDAVVILGTGAPSLRLISAATHEPPVLSCMFSLAWLSSCVAVGQADDAPSLHTWLVGKRWRAALAERYPQP